MHGNRSSDTITGLISLRDELLFRIDNGSQGCKAKDWRGRRLGWDQSCACSGSIQPEPWRRSERTTNGDWMVEIVAQRDGQCDGIANGEHGWRIERGEERLEGAELGGSRPVVTLER